MFNKGWNSLHLGVSHLSTSGSVHCYLQPKLSLIYFYPQFTVKENFLDLINWSGERFFTVIFWAAVNVTKKKWNKLKSPSMLWAVSQWKALKDVQGQTNGEDKGD